MLVATIDLDGAETAEAALTRFVDQVQARLPMEDDPRRPLLELKLVGRVRFHPFELGRERLRLALEEIARPLHVEFKNQLSLVTSGKGEEDAKKSLAEIEHEVLRELIGAGSDYQGREDELIRLALALRDAVQKGETDGEDLLHLLDGEG